MPANTRVLAVCWAPSLRSCFVNLPPSWCASLLASRRAPSEYAVCVEWTEGEVARQRKAYVSWAGGASASSGGNFSAVNPFDRGKDAVAGIIEFDPLFGNTLGLRAGQNVIVELLNASKDASVVQVEPLSPDDWEILELHADFIEHQLLNQVRILAVHQPVAVWIHKTTIKLRVAKTEPADDFVRLSPDCEVVVAPKKRIWDDCPNSLKISRKPSLLCLRVVPLELVQPVNTAALTADQELSVYANSSDLPLSYTASQVVRIRTAHHAQVISRKRLSEGENTELGNTQEGARELYAAVKPDDSIPRGHVAMPQLLRRQLEIEWFDRTFLESASGSPAQASSITLLHGNSRAQGNHLCQCFRDWVSRSKGPLVLTDGMLLCFGRLPDDDGEEVVKLRLPHQDAHIDHGGVDPAVTAFIVETPAALTKVPLAAVDDEPVQLKSYGEQYPVTLLGGIDGTLQNAAQYMDTLLGHPALSWTISAPSAGGMLVLGESGSGKTAFTQQVSSSLARGLGVLSYVRRINCVKLAEERIPVVKIKIREALEDAAWREPAIVLLDDIDKLMPSEVENVDSSRTRLLSETLIDWTWPLLRRRRVTIMASAKNQQSLHPSLIESHLFGHVLHLGSPDKKGRNEILRAICQSLPVGSEAQVSFSSVDFATVASRTEGYLPADLRTLTERAVQECALRIAWEDESAELGSFVEVTTADFDKAQEGFVPVSLRDINLEKSEVRWSDVGGMAAAKQVLLETLELPTKFAAIFAGCPLRLRSGLLLYGYPGCGKTMLASAVARECGLNFISIKGPELLNKYIGASEKSVRDLFERAQAAKPCVLFFDEFDSLAPRRGHDNTGVTDRVVNQLLTQIDGAERVDGVYVLAATSRPDLIDPALLRPGRLDKSIFCDMPSREERFQILTAQTRKLNLADDVDLSEFAELCHGFSGADLQSLLSNAHLEAIHVAIKEPEDVSGKAEQLQKQAEEREYFVISGRTDKRMTRAERGRFAERLARICCSDVRGGDPDSKPKTGDTEIERPQIILRQDHLRRALASMRPSLPSDEHARFQQIYRTYANERSGKARGGLAMNATGERASLV